MALFGVVWAAAGAGALGGATRVILLLLSVALAAALCIGAMRLRGGARDLPRNDSTRAPAQRRRLDRRFNLVFGLQSVAIALSVVLLVRYGLGAFVPAAVALIAGIHFFPLAELFKVRAYHASGAALCVLALVAFFLAPPVRLPVVGLGCAVILFATGAYILSLGGKARRWGAPTV